jgi:hypothetical protein
MKGVLRSLSRLMDSMVCCSRPCIRSTMSTAMSHSPEPRARRLVNDSWPGVSMTSRPGSFMSNERPLRSACGRVQGGGGCQRAGSGGWPTRWQGPRSAGAVHGASAAAACWGAAPHLRAPLHRLAGHKGGADLLRDAARLAVLQGTSGAGGQGGGAGAVSTC